jgi:cystathionine beta-lyase/cystathionine gamma-synthase
MEKKEYFRRLVKLFEADRFDAGEPGAQAQAFAADSGAGVAGNAADQPEQQPIPPGEGDPNSSGAEPDLALGDANYLSAGEASGNVLPPIGDIVEVSEPKKKAKLFDLLRDLLNYSNVFIESLTNIDMNLLDMEQIEKVRKNTDQVDDVIQKVRTYVTETFPTDKYEKALYVYILLRTELMTIINLLRESLGLNAEPETENGQSGLESAQKGLK